MRARALLGAFAAGVALIAAPAVAQRLYVPPPPLTEIRAVDLPPEARATLTLIRKGGPFPYAKDGAIFGNREGMLPRQKRGYYREYTVKTPHERTRGARRIIWGAGGEFYYTDDHYTHFRRIKD